MYREGKHDKGGRRLSARSHSLNGTRHDATGTMPTPPSSLSLFALQRLRPLKECKQCLLDMCFLGPLNAHPIAALPSSATSHICIHTHKKRNERQIWPGMSICILMTSRHVAISLTIFAYQHETPTFMMDRLPSFNMHCRK